MTIIKPGLDTEEVDKLIEKLSESIVSLGGKSLEVEKSGRKKLAYDVKNFRDGFVATIELELPAEQVSEFRRQISLNDNIIRSMFLELSKVK